MVSFVDAKLLKFAPAPLNVAEVKYVIALPDIALAVSMMPTAETDSSAPKKPVNWPVKRMVTARGITHSVTSVMVVVWHA